MKRNIFLAIILVLFNYSNCFAQHCPFDGTSIIMVNIISTNGILQKSNAYDLVLQEIENPNPDTCEYAKGLLKIDFKPVTEMYKQNKNIPDYEKKINVSLIKKGDFYVLLSMAETQCMQPSGNEFTYYDRKFLIVITNKKTGKQNSFIIPRDKIYSLCTNFKWDRIKPLEIKVEKKI